MNMDGSLQMMDTIKQEYPPILGDDDTRCFDYLPDWIWQINGES